MKIKEVNIVGFRSYAHEGDGLFDFTDPSGKVSNFVVIYGPNGFGKSSIYDAIEWAITNNISRYIRDSLRVNNNATSLALNKKDTAQYILRNRYIEDDDLSFVEVKTTKYGPFKRELRRARPGSRDYKFDPKDTTLETKHLTDIFLSQDAIDSFLKEERPEARYEKFMSGFGGEDEIYRQKLYLIRRTSRGEREKLMLQIEALRPELDATVDGDAIVHANQTIVRLQEHGLNFDLISQEYNSAEHLEYQNKILLYREEYSNKSKRINNRNALADFASAQLPEYSVYHQRLELLTAELATDIDHRNTLVATQNIISSITILDKNRSSCVQLLNIHQTYFRSLGSFLEAFVVLRGINSNISTLEAARNKLHADVAECQSSLDSKRIAVANAVANLSHAEMAATGIAELFRTLEKANERLKVLEEQVKTQAKIRDELVIQQNSAIVFRQDIQNLVIDKFMSAETVIKATGDPEIAQEFNDLCKEKDSVRERLKNYETLLDQLTIKNNRIAEIVAAATEVLAHTQGEACPLCSHHFGSNEELMRRILGNEGLSKEQAPLIALIEADENQAAELERRLGTLISLIEERRKILALKITEDIEKLGKSIAECDKSLREISTETNTHNASRLHLSTSTGKLDRTAYEARSAETIKNLISNRDDLTLSWNLLDIKLQKFRLEIEDLDAQLAHQKTTSSNTSEDASYAEVASYLRENGVVDGGELDFFNLKMSELNSKITTISEEILQKNEDLNKVEERLSRFSVPNDLALISSKIEATENILKETRIAIHAVVDAVRNASGIAEGKEAVNFEGLSAILQNAKDEIENERRLGDKSDSALEVLMRQLDLVLKFADTSRMEIRIASLQSEVKLHESIEASLSNEFVTVEKNLLERISEFFYKELINSIYSKIDPHPSFKTVDFTCVFPENGDKPRLEICLREEDGEPISPNFYFSAAQLNVLSLSIFLARALHVQHEGEPVQSILIDDPIQSMDSINILSTVDLLRGISQRFDRQIILSTHDENFFELLKMKVPEAQFNSKFIKLAGFGKVHGV